MKNFFKNVRMRLADLILTLLGFKCKAFCEGEKLVTGETCWAWFDSTGTVYMEDGRQYRVHAYTKYLFIGNPEYFEKENFNG